MGVDARMFVRLSGDEKLTEAQVKQLSFEVAAAHGHDVFWTTRVDPGNEMQSLCSGYRPLSIIEPLTKEELRDHEWDEEGHLDHLEGKVVWFQDGDEVVAADDEQFIRVRLYGRYWGPDYERGDWPTLRCVIDWLKFRIGGQVWYGGDSSGMCAEPMTPERREEFDRLFFESGRIPYVYYSSKYSQFEHPKCPTCGPSMYESGGGGGMGPEGYSFFGCLGCGARLVKDNGGARRETWSKHGEEIFKTAERHRGEVPQPNTSTGEET